MKNLEFETDHCLLEVYTHIFASAVSHKNIEDANNC